MQSELTTKTVAENCLALTADAVNRHQSAYNVEEPSPHITQRNEVGMKEDAVVEEFHVVGVTQRRGSYLQAIMHSDSVPQDFDVEADLDITASAAVDEIQPSALDIVSELEEPRVDEALTELGPPAETIVEKENDIQNPEISLDEILECGKEASGTDESSTRADILDNGSEELDVEDMTELPPVASQTETSRSASVSVEDDFAVYDSRDPEKSHFPDVESQSLRLPDVSPSPTEQETEVVWIRRTYDDIPPTDCSASMPEPRQEEDSSTNTLPILDQSAEGCSSVSKLSPSPPPPPPIDVIAIDMTGQRLSDDVPRDVEELRSSVDDEYCHSPLGGAMPESEDSSIAEFVFP